MSNLGTKGMKSDDTRKISPYITYGIQNLRINSIEVKTAKTGSKQCIFHMETRPVTLSGFKGVDDAAGQVGKVKFPLVYIKPSDDESVTRLLTQIAIMGDKFRTRAQIDEIVWTGDFDAYMAAVAPHIQNRFAWWKLVGETYTYSKEGEPKKGVTLSIPRFGFIATEAEGKDHLKFDKTNSYDFKDEETPDQTPADVAKTGTDLPF